MAKRSPRKILKDKAWKVFSEYIRRKYSDSDGYCVCVTCGKKDHWKSQQAGHAIGGRTNAILFHEDIVFPQCKGCNIFKNGNYTVYTLFMIDTYGRERFEELLALKNKTVKLSNSDLQEILDTYKEKISHLD